MKIKKDSDLMFVMIWTIFTIIFIITPILKDSVIRTIIGIPFILFIPGYVLVAVLFPNRYDLEDIERIALSFGSSIAIVSLIGLLLNYTFGIRLIPIIVSLSVYTVTFLIIANYRREKLSYDYQFSVQFRNIWKIFLNNEKNDKICRIGLTLNLIFIFLTISAIGMVVYVIIVPRAGEEFTEFYILNSTSKDANNYYTNLNLSSNPDIIVGVVNHEHKDLNYTVNIELDKKVLSYEKLLLKNNEIWEKKMDFNPNKIGNNMKIEFFLFKENNFTIPYRELHLWVNTT